MFAPPMIRILLRTFVTPIAALVLVAAGASFAVATGSHTPVPRGDDGVYPCIPDHVGHDDGDGGKDDYGKSTSRYFTTSTNGGTSGGSHGDDDDDGQDHCKPECPPKSDSKSMTTTTYGGSTGGSGGSHGDDDDDGNGGSHGDDDDDGNGGNGGNDCKPECPPKSDSKSVTTSTYGGSHSGSGDDDCEPCEDDKAASKSSSSSSSGSHGKDCDDVKPGCGPDKTDGVAGNSGRHEGQPPKADDRKDCPNPPGQQKQIATTGGSSNLKAASASIAGTINPKGNATMGYFEYGKSGSFGSITASQSMGNGSADKSLSGALTGLTPNTTYSYRVVSTSGKGTVNGDTKTFKTPADAPKCTTVSAGSLTKNSAKLAGKVNPGGGATNAYFEYGTSSSSLGSKSGSQAVGSGTSDAATSSSLTGLKANTKYYYRVAASNGSGSGTGAVLSFTTPK
jgi:hypothetical protein